ncbi:nitrate ABC transporter permease [Planomonospora parontospora subsp. parontospora]|uniref:Nitrate ABC transporter permease n=2 Tax=Planomonospora parontospora TaxID=58119 RepID=A0AA37BID6_9ACTN|nr:ABC transporter permease [Planomonospora parontospora]GGK75230.1 nitrate ABC transporter permease [Planomonospora parontospora]GII09501.1 nitrate ABC transporter permease [Planomonospora parontospora subsp. parontospora]
MTAPGAGDRAASAAAWIARLWIVPVALLGWELAARLAGAVYFPPPSAILVRLHELWFSGPLGRLFLTQEAVDHLLPSLGRLLLGWAAACAVAVVAGVALGRSASAYDCVNPLIHFFRSIPPPLLIPIAMTLTGVGTPLQLAAIVFGVVWPVLINTLDGARHVDRAYLETCEVFGVSRTAQLLRVILPAMAPKVFAGLRISVALALIMMIISEYVGSTEGIGYHMLVAQSQVDIASMWTAIVLLGVLGFVLNSLFLRVERRVLAWHRSARRTG